MEWQQSDDRMPEAEVSIRLAEYLSELPGFGGHVDVAIDGASISVHGAEVFDIAGYLRTFGWETHNQDTSSRNVWAATYRRAHATMRIHSRSGVGDVEAVVQGRRIVAECKKGPLVRKPGSPEYPLLTTALGQALLFRAGGNDILVAAVPDSPTFRRIAADWRERPRVKASGIRIALVNREGGVEGLDLPSS
ncbi:hypothetical protein EOD08_21225 [Mesorhizobium sp. M6A.T.Ca.TU.002.02.2.1]|nr:hypothetical protein EOD08_21225 [Mesorhizobium sp. M6A.T.Ca.TU.002.02.2.1]RWP62309.1 MAG: hypothetical protein EOR07_21005 [Mesorhizobium sp.]RWQ12855.1 MAG: hypothetical protein EOR92_32300 [Mesorhizobium sp.]